MTGDATMTRRVALIAIATALATGLAGWLAGGDAWGHSFPPVRTVVLQVERCELVVLVGYRPRSGEDSDTILAQASNAPKSQAFETMRGLLTAHALAPLEVTVGGAHVTPTSVQAKLGIEPGGTRPMVVVLVTYPIPAAGALAVTSKDPKTTRFSWQDRSAGRVEIGSAPQQTRWFIGVASFLLTLTATRGDTTCAAPPSAAL